MNTHEEKQTAPSRTVLHTPFQYLSIRVWATVVAATILFLVTVSILFAYALESQRSYLAILAALLFTAYVLLSIFFLRHVVYHYKETERVLKLFDSGYTIEDVYSLLYPYSPWMMRAFERLKTLLDTDKLLSASKRQAQYLALQNQINPHFLYNTLEGIRGEALSRGLTTVADMSEALSTYFRYTISNVENLVTIEDELGNIETYFAIQQYRFGPRMKLDVQVDVDDRATVMGYRIPKLTLQPIVENAIVHGLEAKVGYGTVTIQIDVTQSRLLIRIADDGVGMDLRRVEQLNGALTTRSFEYIRQDREKHGGIAILNVNNRLKLLFGEEYGVIVSSTPGVGTDVEISLPKIPAGNTGELS